MQCVLTSRTVGRLGEKGERVLVGDNYSAPLARFNAAERSADIETRDRVIKDFTDRAKRQGGVRKVDEALWECGDAVASLPGQVQRFAAGLTTCLVKGDATLKRTPFFSLATLLGQGKVSLDELATATEGAFVVFLYDALRNTVAVARDESGAEELWWCKAPGGGLIFATTKEDCTVSYFDKLTQRKEVTHPKEFPPGHFFLAGGGAATLCEPLATVPVALEGHPSTPRGHVWVPGREMRKVSREEAAAAAERRRMDAEEKAEQQRQLDGAGVAEPRASTAGVGERKPLTAVSVNPSRPAPALRLARSVSGADLRRNKSWSQRLRRRGDPSAGAAMVRTAMAVKSAADRFRDLRENMRSALS